MKRRILNFILALTAGLLGIGGFFASGNPLSTTAFQSPLSSSMSPRAFLPLLSRQQPPPSPFLRAPYYGTQYMSSVFDHNLPNGINDGSVTPYNGITSTVLNYAGHAGYDYVLRYESVLAAANGRVSQARWNQPGNHRFGLGLFVRMEHDNGYATLYGHLSATTVDVDTNITDAENGRVIGISGNTGHVDDENCDPNTSPMCSAHLHFEVKRNNFAVDPFGWSGNYMDPWVDHQEEPNKSFATSHNVWLEYPAISNPARDPNCPYPSGTPRPTPTPPSGAGTVIVDDGGANYTETPNCWTAASPAAAYGGDLRYTARVTATATCQAQWNLPAQAGAGGDYQVYAHVISYSLALPSGYVSTQGVTYTIHHAGQTDFAILNQWAFTNTSHTSPWVYLGTYAFTRNGGEYVSVSNLTSDLDAERYVLADAVKFVPLNPPPATPTPTPTPTRTPTPTPTPTPTSFPCPPTSGPYEPNNSFTQAAWITGSVNLIAYIECASDNDYYAFQTSVPSNKTRHIEITLTVPSSVDYDLFLYNANYQQVRSSEKRGAASEYIYYAVATPGNHTFYIKVKPFAGYSTSTPYGLQLRSSLSGESIPAGETVSASGVSFGIAGSSRSLPTSAAFSSPLPVPALLLPGLAIFGSEGEGWLQPMDDEGQPRGPLQPLVGFASQIRPGCEWLHFSPSPDGRYLAAQANCEWGGYVVLADRVNGQVTRLGGVLGWESLFLDWEPGNPPRLVVRAEPAGAGGVYRVDPRTLEAEHLPVPEETYDVAFSPDGERVLFAVTEGLGHGSELWMMNRDGSSLTRLVSEQRHILALPRWSPDGKRWAYIRMPDSEVPFPVGELWVMDGKNARLLSDWADAGRGYGPVWSPDGQTVAFVARENVADRLADLLLSRLESNLYLADIATGRVQAVTRFENAWIEEPVWSPDGHQLIFHGIIGARPGIWQVHLASRRFSLLIPDDARAIVWIPEIPNQ